MQRSSRWSKHAVAGAAGVLAALGVATSLTQAQTSTSPTSTATTPTTPTTTTKTTTTKKAAPKATTKTITCRESLVATKAADNAENFGTVSCTTPFGKGVRHDTSALAAPSKTAGSFTGGLKLFFNSGTLRGTFKLNFTVAGKTVTYDGTVKISSGTGEFASVTGTGTTTGTSSDGVHATITDKLTLKIPPKKTTS